MTPEQLLDLFRRSGALLDGHFRLSSGLHSAGYLQCALVLQHPAHAEALGRADCARDGSNCARQWCCRRRSAASSSATRWLARSACARCLPNGRTACSRCGADSCSRTIDRVLVVEDVLTTGGSTRETIQVAVAAGGQVVGAASIVDRSGGKASFDVPFHALVAVDLPDLRAGRLPALRPGPAGGEARLTAHHCVGSRLMTRGLSR